VIGTINEPLKYKDLWMVLLRLQQIGDKSVAGGQKAATTKVKRLSSQRLASIRLLLRRSSHQAAAPARAAPMIVNRPEAHQGAAAAPDAEAAMTDTPRPSVVGAARPSSATVRTRRR